MLFDIPDSRQRDRLLSALLYEDISTRSYIVSAVLYSLAQVVRAGEASVLNLIDLLASYRGG
jgi:hypothetical protein